MKRTTPFLRTILLWAATLALLCFSTSSRAALVAQWGDSTFGQSPLPASVENIKAIAAGWRHSLALKTDGSVVAWGYNDGGATNVSPGLSNVIAISARSSQSLALKSDGTVVGWGNEITSPPLSSLSNIVAIAAGWYHWLALTSEGDVVTAGVGRASYNPANPVNIPAGLTNIISIAAGIEFSLVLKADGTVTAWGWNQFSQTNVPPDLSNVVAIAAGFYHGLALRADGTVVAWGSVENPTVPLGLSNVVAIAAGAYHSLALKADGSVVAWWANHNGLPDYGQTIVPPGLVRVKAIAAGEGHSLALVFDGPIKIVQNPQSQTINYLEFSNVTLSVTATGSGQLTYQWFRNGAAISNDARKSGATGTALTILNPLPSDSGNYTVLVRNAFGSVISSTAVLTVISPPFITQQPIDQTVRAGTDVILSALADGTPALRYQWNFNSSEILRATNGTILLTNVQPSASGLYFMRVTNLYGLAETIRASLAVTDTPPYFIQQPYVRKPDQGIATNLVAPIGGSASILVTARGSTPLFYQWKFNGLAIPDATNSTLTLTHLRYDQAGYYNVEASNAFGSTNSAKFFLNVSHVLIAGTPFADNVNTPLALSNVIAVAAGGSHVMALRSDGTVRTWLANLGYIADSNVYAVTNVPLSATNVIAIAAGRNHCLALRSNGTVLAWGGNNNDQTNTPASLSNVVSIAAGTYNSFAVRSDGTVVGWGNSSLLHSSLSNVVAIAAQYSGGNLALRRDGSVVTWSSSGQLPTVVAGRSNIIAITSGSSQHLFLNRDGVVFPGGRATVPQGATNVVAIAGGEFVGEFLKQDGTLVTTGFERTPFPVTNNIIAIAAGGLQTGFGVAVVGNGSPVITLQPVSQIVQRSNTVQLHTRAASAQPMRYQWLLDNLPLSGATNSSLVLSNILGKDTGSYRMIASNALGIAASQIAVITIPFNTNLPAALNATNLTWLTPSDKPPTTAWFVQNRETHDGDAAAQSGMLTNNGISSIQVSLPTAGTLTFWWKVSSEEDYDFLRVFVDSSTTPLFSITGETGWEQRSITFTNGQHTMRWSYSKDVSVSAGRDAGWLDEVTFTPALPVANITPVIQTVSAGSNTSFFAVTTSDAKPVTYQWMRSGTNIAGATNQTLSLLRAGRRDRGNYSVRVGNPGGSIVTSNAVLRVIAPQHLGLAQRTQDGAMEIVSRDADDGTLLPQDLPLFEAQASTNLLSWETLPNVLSVTNDALLLRDTNVGRLPQRFYRIVEH